MGPNGLKPRIWHQIWPLLLTGPTPFNRSTVGGAATIEDEGSPGRFSELGIPRVLDTSQHDLVSEFFEPLLSQAVAYDRGVGYFSSGWIETNARGLASFAENGGEARFITSPILGEQDQDALLQGEKARRDEELKSRLTSSVDDLEKELEEETLNALAWLVADGVLTFRIALPAGGLSGEFHDKFGIFTDGSDDRVVFNGSYNDSIKGLRNYESLKVFFSWVDEDEDLVAAEEERFERLWKDEDPNVDVLDIPTSVRRQVMKLRSDDRPYDAPPEVEARGARHGKTGPQIPFGIELRPYQKQAVNAWLEADGRGILKMATGTGKTITALGLLTRLTEFHIDRGQPLVTLILCPYEHLVDQWNEEARDFGFSPVLCYRGKHRWMDDFNGKVTEINVGARDHLFAIATYATLRSEAFQQALQGIRAPLMVVADEVHNAGAPHTMEALPPNPNYRLGLSATPERWRDEEGTEDLEDYFGKIEFSYDLEDAIEGDWLSPYDYHPVIVRFTDDELTQYLALTEKIGKAFAADEDFDSNERLQNLLIKRARLMASAEEKLPALQQTVKAHEVEDLPHNLFYCGDGSIGTETHETERRQVDAVTELLGTELGMRVSQYLAETPSDERRQILEDFEEGLLNGLVAIRCLDEGVDIPATRRAFILASTSNPRQFIQRRGRILRQAPGKDAAEIWDFVVVPPYEKLDDSAFNQERSLVQNELRRVVQFAELARNGPQAQAELRDVKKEYNLMHM